MLNLNWKFQSITKRCLSLARNRDSLANAGIIIISIIILGMWLTGVVFTTAHHEFWRDEVRALSFACAADSPLHLFKLIQYDGHPILWYLLLYFGTTISDTPSILPILSIFIAFAAVTIFIFFSPFPLWLKTVFIFSVLPFYEYAVVARNYGISMMFFFLFAALYKKKNEYPLLLAIVLFLLANTNVHSAILVWPLVLIWFWDTVVERRTLSVKSLGISLYAPLVIVFFGFVLCLLTTWPRDNTIVTDLHSLSLINVTKFFIKAILFPARNFNEIIQFPGPADQIMIWLAIVGLIPRINLFLAAITGQAVLSVFFRLVYVGALRHQGLFLVFLIVLYWIALENLNLGYTERLKKVLFNTGLYISLLLLIFIGLYKAQDRVIRDIRWELSSSQTFGAFLNGSPIYREAIIIPEPDYLVESLPYYAKNKIYLPREQRFSKTVSWTTNSKDHISLGDLLVTGYKIRNTHGRPVLIVLGHWNLDQSETNEKRFGFKRMFSWNAKDLSELNRKTKLVRRFKSARGDENYMVYAID